MTAPELIATAALGGVGAVARFGLDGGVGRRVASDFPYGTLAVNLVGAFILGVLAGAWLGTEGYLLAGTGLIGGFTTFSTWAFESHRLGEDRQLGLAVVNFVVSLVLGVFFAWAGWRLGAPL